MKIEYNEYLCEYYCSLACLTARLFDYMENRDVPLNISKFINHDNIKVSKDSKLFIDKNIIYMLRKRLKSVFWRLHKK